MMDKINTQYNKAVKLIKSAILQNQLEAAKAVNRQMLALYYGVGKYVSDIWKYCQRQRLSKSVYSTSIKQLLCIGINTLFVTTSRLTCSTTSRSVYFQHYFTYHYFICCNCSKDSPVNFIMVA